MKLYSEHWINDVFVPVILYGDESGITDQESEQLDDWGVRLPGTYTWNVTDDVDEFHLCEITGLYGRCARIEVYV